MTTPLLLNGATQQRILRAMPDVLQPAWLKETWAGEHGSARLRAEVTDTRSDMQIEDGVLTGSSSVDGRVLTPEGRDVGTFTRDQTLHESGRAEVHHSYMVLNDRTHGTGFARSFNERAFARYAAAGVDDVTIEAALSVGGYAWARQGFELIGNASDRAMQVRDLVDYSDHLTRADRKLLDQWLIRDDGSLPEHGLDSVQDLAAIPGVGRRALLGNDWEGQRAIPRTTAWWSKYDRAARMDAFNGVSHLKTPDLVEQRVRTATEAITNRMPAPLSHVALADAVRTSLGGNADVTAGALNIRTWDGTLESSSSRATLRVPESLVDVRISASRGNQFNVSEQSTKVSASLRSSLDDAYRSLGIATVSTGAQSRTL